MTEVDYATSIQMEMEQALGPVREKRQQIADELATKMEEVVVLQTALDRMDAVLTTKNSSTRSRTDRTMKQETLTKLRTYVDQTSGPQSIQQVADGTGVARETARRGLEQLAKDGFLSFEGGRGRGGPRMYSARNVH